MKPTCRFACTMILAVTGAFAGSLGCAALATAREVQQRAPDNSKTNQRDRDKAAATADKQKMSAEDR